MSATTKFIKYTTGVTNSKLKNEGLDSKITKSQLRRKVKTKFLELLEEKEIKANDPELHTWIKNYGFEKPGKPRNYSWCNVIADRITEELR